MVSRTQLPKQGKNKCGEQAQYLREGKAKLREEKRLLANYSNAKIEDKDGLKKNPPCDQIGSEVGRSITIDKPHWLRKENEMKEQVKRNQQGPQHMNSCESGV